MKNNYWLTSGFYSLLNQVTMLFFNLGTVFILWRVLDKPTCSIWVIFLLITSFIEVGRTGLLQNGLMTYIGQTPQSEHAKINTASLFLSLILSVLFSIFLLTSGAWIGHFFNQNPETVAQIATLLNIYAGTTLVLSGLYQFNFIQQANLDFKGLFWSSFIKNGLLFFYVLYLKLTNNAFNLNHLAICQWVAAIPATFAAYLFARKYFVLDKKLDWHWVKKLFHYGKYTFGTNMATMTYKNVDRLILSMFLLDKVSTYDLAIKINTLTEVPTMTLAAILFPKSAQSASKSLNTEGVSTAKYLYEKSVGVLLAILLPAVLFVLIFADIIIQIIGSEKYMESAPILRVTIFYGVFMAFAMQFGTILDSIGKPKLNFYITLLGAIVNLSFNFVFIKWLGLYGAAYGSLTAMTIMFFIMQIILNKLLGIKAWHTLTYMMAFYKEIWTKLSVFFNKKALKTV